VAEQHFMSECARACRSQQYRIYWRLLVVTRSNLLTEQDVDDGASCSYSPVFTAKWKEDLCFFTTDFFQHGGTPL